MKPACPIGGKGPPCPGTSGASRAARSPADRAVSPSSSGLGIDACEFGAEEEYLRRVIDPEQEYGNGADRPQPGHGNSPPEVNSDQLLPYGEKRRCRGGPDPDIAPIQCYLGYHLEDHRKHDSDQCKADEQVQKLRGKLPFHGHGGRGLHRRREYRRNKDRNQEEQRYPEYHPPV